ncbi:IQ domain-containing protein H [Phytophthora citrophthora]|uniref:IQ domain-containing protein H n=1 Tax=Phytophthora citrophthora TaxID=4793 RepID=A0AAD9GDW7_9STRA|nr:IQ domain-containing protein H [Phytophthora citrophthora]
MEKTQEQLRVMREQMTAAAAAVEANSSPMRHSAVVTTAEVQAFNAILQRTETELRAKAELVLNGMVNSSSLEQNNQSQSSTVLPAVTVATPPSIKHRSGYSGACKPRRTDASSIPMEFFREQFRNSSVEVRQSLMPSPQHWQRHLGLQHGRLMRKKTTQHCRLLPSVNKADPTAPTPELREEDAKHGVLNLVTRGFLPAYADLTPAFASGANDGVMKQRATRIHDRSEQSARPTPFTQSTGYNLATLKFDLRAPPTPPPPAPETPLASSAASTRRQSTRRGSARQGASRVTMSFPAPAAGDKNGRSARQKSLVSAAIAAFTNQDDVNDNRDRFSDQPDDVSDEEQQGEDKDEEAGELGANVDKIRGYNELLDAYSLHQFLIHKGRTMRDTPEFISFRRVAQELWGSVEEALRALETLLTHYFVPLAYVDGQRLLSLAATGQPRFSKRELLSCIVNEEQVMAALRRPGQRYKGRDRKRRAATTIQACVRMWAVRRRYIRSRACDINATRIQLAWRAYSCHAALKARLREVRREQIEKWEARMHHLKSQWAQIAGRRRVVVHVPSLSLGEHSRLSAENLAVQQNLQLTRICAAALDSHVDLLVYVSPFELTTDVSQYFIKLLQLGGLADSRPRVKLLFPEQATRFPAHFSLSSLLLYSPHCLRRIRHYTTGKEAYLVMGLPGAEDQRLAMALDLPILGAPPAQALPLLTRSGGKRLLIRADVNVPAGTYELYDEHELFSALAKLAVAHMEQPKWLLKLDYDPLGVGEIVVDMSGMQAMRELRREKRTPEYWRQPGPRDAAAKLVLTELERPGTLSKLATPMHTEIFPTWLEFAEAIGHFGCVIEAVPPIPITVLLEASTALMEPAYVRANLFVNPDGSVHVTSTQNMLATGGGGLNRKTVAYTFPQTAAPHEAVKGACSAAGKLLVETNVWGYVSLDFVVFQDDKSNGAPRLWALAVHPFLTDSAASFACFHLLARGVLDANSGVYRVAVANSALVAANAGRSESGGTTGLLLREATLAKRSLFGAPRCFVVCSYVFHPHVTTMQYTAFFHACRLHGVCFDVERILGTLFLLADSLTAGVFGVLSIGETTEGALAFMRTALEVIGREAGATIEMAPSTSRPVSGNFAQVLAAVRAATGGKDRLGKMRRMRK